MLQKNSFYSARFLLLCLTYITFLVYLIFSVYFYKERVCYIDSAYYLFQILEFDAIKGGSFRYGGFLPQIPVFILQKFDVNLKFLILTFSVSFALIHLCIFYIVKSILKNPYAAYAIIFIQIICIGDSYFHAINETHQAITYAILYFSWLGYCIKGNVRFYVNILISSLIIAIGLLTHPVFVLLILFIWIYKYIELNNKKVDTSIWLGLILFILVYILKKVLIKTPGYDNEFYEQLKDVSNLLNIKNLASSVFFANYFWNLYSGVIVLLIATIYTLLKLKKGKLAIVTLGYFAFSLVLSLIIYNKGDSKIMMERSFMMLGLVAILPLFMHIPHIISTKHRQAVVVIILMTTILSFIRIYNSGLKYKERIAYSYELLHRYNSLGIKKAVIKNSDIDMNKIEIPWTYAVETLFLSTLAKQLPSQTIYIANDANRIKKFNAPDLFLCVHFWDIWNSNKLSEYYPLPETNYVWVE